MSLNQTTVPSVVTHEVQAVTGLVNPTLQDNCYHNQIKMNNQQKNHRLNRIRHKRVPWLKPGVQLSFHEEILSFASWVSPTPEEHKMRRDVIQRVKNVVLELWPNAKVDFLVSLFIFISHDKKIFKK
jgi:non-canonical poly(A) RNA polymerase PAPD5/7